LRYFVILEQNNRSILLDKKEGNYGGEWVLSTENSSTVNKYKKVEFLDYRPHPGELLIKEDGITKVIHRRTLYSRNKGSISGTCE